MRKALAVTPPVVVSTVLTCMFGALLPSLAGAVLFLGGLASAGMLALGRGEALAVRVLYRGRRPTEVETAALAPAITLLCQVGLGPPAVGIWVRGSDRSIAAGGVGRRSVIVSAGLVAATQDGQLPADQVAAVMARSAGLIHAGLVRSDPLIRFWTLPWQVLSAAVATISTVVRRAPGTYALWQLRFVLGAITVVQTTAEGHWPLGALVAAITCLSYTIPTWERSWNEQLLRAGDHQALEHGLAPALAQFLRRRPRNAKTRERISRLEDPTKANLQVVNRRP